jgi:hypothetical protein
LIKLSKGVFFTGMLVAVVGLFSLLTLDLSRNARLVPLVVAIPTLGLLLFQLLIQMVASLANLRTHLEESHLFRIERFRQPSSLPHGSNPGIAHAPDPMPKDVPLGAHASSGPGVLLQQARWRRALPGVFTRERPERRELSVISWAVMLLGSIYLLGFSLAIPLFTFLYLKGRSGEGWRLSLAVAGGMWGLLHGVFVLLLRVRLHDGRLWEWLRL